VAPFRLKMHKSAFLINISKENLKEASLLRLDSVFIGNDSISSENIDLIRNLFDGDIFVEVRVFAGKDNLEKFPDAQPVESAGKDVVKDWHNALCPTHGELRKEVLDKIGMAAEMGIDGIWLDFIRYPTKWEGSEPVLLDTCYCARCVSKFEGGLGEKVSGSNLEETAQNICDRYYLEWLNFKEEQITSFVKEAKKVIDSSNRKIKLGFFAVPWEEQEYGDAIKRIIGQDFESLSKIVGVLSPMLYHRMCGKPVEWVKKKVEYFWQYGTPLLPLVQTENREGELKAEEFKSALQYAVQEPSQGVCIFFLDDLVKQPEKYEVARELFSS